MQAEEIFRIFDSSDFMARGQCGLWTGPLKAAYILSNAAIALAYTLISANLVRLWTRRHDILGPSAITIGFAAFIGACGLSHLCDVTVFWWPAYRFYTVVDATTAALSIATALVFPAVVSHLIRLPTNGEFLRLNEELQRTCAMKEQAIDRLADTIRTLRRQVTHLERLRETGLWAEEQEKTLCELRALLNPPSPRTEPS